MPEWMIFDFNDNWEDYDGELKTFFISNKGTEDIIVEYTYAKY